MFIVKKDELGKYPVGTIYASYEPHIIGDLMMLTGPGLIHFDGSIGWNGALPLSPDISDRKDGIIYSNWCTTDDSDADYFDNQLFVVFTKEEIKRMILILGTALGEVDFDDMYRANEWIHDKRIVTHDEMKEKGLLLWG